MEDELDTEEELADLDLLEDLEPDDYDGPAREIIGSIERIRFRHGGDLEEGQVERIVSLCYTAIRVDPECFPAYMVLGSMDYRNGEYDQMMEHYLKGLDLCDDPTRSAYTTDEVYENLYEGMRVREGAEDWHRIARYEERFHEKAPHYDSLRTLSHIYTNELDDPERAAEFIDEYARRFPRDAALSARLALRVLNDHGRARAILEQRLEEEPGDRLAQRLLRRVH